MIYHIHKRLGLIISCRSLSNYYMMSKLLNIQDDEEQANKEWLRSLSSLLLGNGKRSFLETISKCIGSGNVDLVRACLTTVAWLSSTLGSPSDAEFQLSAAFSALISQLLESLERSQQLEHKILASMSLFNFSKISGQPHL